MKPLKNKNMNVCQIIEMGFAARIQFIVQPEMKGKQEQQKEREAKKSNAIWKIYNPIAVCEYKCECCICLWHVMCLRVDPCSGVIMLFYFKDFFRSPFTFISEFAAENNNNKKGKTMNKKKKKMMMK